LASPAVAAAALMARWRSGGSARWPRRNRDAHARRLVGTPGCLPALGPKHCPWPIPWGLLRRSSQGGATVRRVLPAFSACQARWLCGGRRMRERAKDVTGWLFAPRGMAQAHRGSSSPRIAPPNPPRPAWSALPKGASSETTAGWNEVDWGWVTFAQLACRGTGTPIVRMVLAGKTCSDGWKSFRCVYEELDPHSMRDWMGRQFFCGPVRPVKAGLLSGRQSHRGNSQDPRSLRCLRGGNESEEAT